MNIRQTLPTLVELHAHLNGCLSMPIVQMLPLLEHEWTYVDQLSEPTNEHNAWKKFSLIEKLINSPLRVRELAREVVVSFAQSGVGYLELRSTPKIFPHSTLRDYVVSFLSGMKEGEAKAKAMGLAITSRALLSINRQTHSEELAHEIIRLSLDSSFHPMIVGIDFSGNPNPITRNLKSEVFFPLIQKIWTETHLSIGIHYAEDQLEINEETEQLSSFLEDKQKLWKNRLRLGHAAYLNQLTIDRIAGLKVPIEMCLTSNTTTMNWGNRDIHHHPCLQLAKVGGVPIIPCTDDPGFIFETTVESEYLSFFQIYPHLLTRSYFESSILKSAFISEEVLSKIFNH